MTYSKVILFSLLLNLIFCIFEYSFERENNITFEIKLLYSKSAENLNSAKEFEKEKAYSKVILFSLSLNLIFCIFGYSFERENNITFRNQTTILQKCREFKFSKRENKITFRNPTTTQKVQRILLIFYYC